MMCVRGVVHKHMCETQIKTHGRRVESNLWVSGSQFLFFIPRTACQAPSERWMIKNARTQGFLPSQPGSSPLFPSTLSYPTPPARLMPLSSPSHPPGKRHLFLAWIPLWVGGKIYINRSSERALRPIQFIGHCRCSIRKFSIYTDF